MITREACCMQINRSIIFAALIFKITMIEDSIGLTYIFICIPRNTKHIYTIYSELDTMIGINMFQNILCNINKIYCPMLQYSILLFKLYTLYLYLFIAQYQFCSFANYYILQSISIFLPLYYISIQQVYISLTRPLQEKKNYGLLINTIFLLPLLYFYMTFFIKHNVSLYSFF